MDEIVHAVASGFRLAVFFGCTAAIFTAVMVTVCRWLKWAPVNITVNVNNNGPIEGRFDDVGDVHNPK